MQKQKVRDKSYALERFFSYTSVDRETGCWNWTGPRDGHGYPMLSVNDKLILAHRYAHEQLIGPIPEGMVLAHFPFCRTKCPNPEHSRPLSKGNNTREYYAIERNLPTHCSRQHEFTEENTLWTKSGYRKCRICIRTGNKERHERRVGVKTPKG